MKLINRILIMLALTAGLSIAAMAQKGGDDQKKPPPKEKPPVVNPQPKPPPREDPKPDKPKKPDFAVLEVRVNRDLDIA